MHQLTLVSYIRNKPAGLENSISRCKQFISDSEIGHFFKPYQTEQIHATLIGLEMIEKEGLLYNKNFFEKTRENKPVRLESLQKIITECLPLSIRFGGFKREYDHFLSAGRTPFERSFGIDPITRKIVLMGWPHTANIFDQALLLKYRKNFEDQCHVSHKYENDNDLYLVLGELDDSNNARNKNSDALIQSVQELNRKVRQFMAENPTDIMLTTDDIYLVMYSDPQLPLHSTKVIQVQEFLHQLPELISDFYFGNKF
jgi:hypothetical protein